MNEQKATIAQQEAELEHLRKRISELETAIANERQAWDHERSSLVKTVDDLTEKLTIKEKEEEELLLLLADQDLKLKELGVADDLDDVEDPDGGIQ